MRFIDKQITYFKERKETVLQKLLELGVDTESLRNSEKPHLFELNKEILHDLKIACVMDKFTLNSYAPECQLLELTPDGWKNEIDSFQPDMIFIESAWEGKDKLWYRKIANGSKEYFEMASYCQSKNIPIVFWNKEDPVYTDTFMPAARMADVVFTTDIDCIKKYKNTLKHDNVYFLHFAAQPEIHNPIEKYERKDKYCFAGAYYHKYKERSEVFDKFSDVFINTKGFDIYDRNYKNALPEHAFPSRYDKYILGNLDPKDIEVAYKGYNYGINMNSVNQSQTMFARRVFEMLASNTVTIGNYSRGVKNLFGDLTICTNDSQTMENALNTWCKDDVTYRKYRLLGLRKVLQEHLYEDRLSYIVEKVFQKNIKRQLPNVCVFAEITDELEGEYIQALFAKQSYQNKRLYLICDNNDINVASVDVSVLSKEKLSGLNWTDFERNTYMTVWNVKDYYGKNYLLDLVLTLRYGSFQGIGKQAYYENTDGQFILHNKNMAYKLSAQLSVVCSIFSLEYCISIWNNPSQLLNIDVVFGDNFISVDEFNYCRNWNNENCEQVDDMFVADQGITMSKIQLQSENIKRSLLEPEQGEILAPDNFMQYVKLDKVNNISGEQRNNKLFIHSALGNDENQYVYIEHFYDVDTYKENGKLSLIFEGNGSLDFLGVCVFYDSKKKKLSPVFTKANRIFMADFPEKAKYFKLGFRFRGAGEYEIVNVMLGTKELQNGRNTFLSRSNVLVLSNQYPSPDNLYRNMFVHQRMSAYKKEGHVFDVMRMNIYAKEEFSEFEGINIVEGQSEVLDNILSNGEIGTVCVHFLDRQMWEVLKKYLGSIRLLIWSHGSDIQPWWRRTFNFTSDAELEKGKSASVDRMKLWNEVFEIYEKYNIEFVFVSQYAGDMIMEDYNIQFSAGKYHIIPNCIDTDIFDYEKKETEQRKRIISIRPYASRIYGNDITIKVIQELAKQEYFFDLEFLIIGDGELFNETVAPIRKYKNVKIEKRFLRQNEIADLYRQYGVVLIPTRGDTQGVSRDEAMACGVVPITNAVAAIPEFVDDTCAILAEGEDYMGMAEGIEKLYKNPEFFDILSKNAAARVRKQTTKEFTIDKELMLINGV